MRPQNLTDPQSTQPVICYLTLLLTHTSSLHTLHADRSILKAMQTFSCTGECSTCDHDSSSCETKQGDDDGSTHTHTHTHACGGGGVGGAADIEDMCGSKKGGSTGSGQCSGKGTSNGSPNTGSCEEKKQTQRHEGPQLSVVASSAPPTPAPRIMTGADGAIWATPSSLEDVFSILSQYKDRPARLVVGNTSTGVVKYVNGRERERERREGGGYRE